MSCTIAALNMTLAKTDVQISPSENACSRHSKASTAMLATMKFQKSVIAQNLGTTNPTGRTLFIMSPSFPKPIFSLTTPNELHSEEGVDLYLGQL